MSTTPKSPSTAKAASSPCATASPSTSSDSSSSSNNGTTIFVSSSNRSRGETGYFIATTTDIHFEAPDDIEIPLDHGEQAQIKFGASSQGIGGDTENDSGMMSLPPQLNGVPPHWLSYFAVEDVDIGLREGLARTIAYFRGVSAQSRSSRQLDTRRPDTTTTAV